jgi:hypothetical protein
VAPRARNLINRFEKARDAERLGQVAERSRLEKLTPLSLGRVCAYHDDRNTARYGVLAK